MIHCKWNIVTWNRKIVGEVEGDSAGYFKSQYWQDGNITKKTVDNSSNDLQNGRGNKSEKHNLQAFLIIKIDFSLELRGKVEQNLNR